MPLARIKKMTDQFKISVREEMRRLQAFYRTLGACSHCHARLMYDALGQENRPGAWRIALADHGHPAREVAVCAQCSAAPLAAAAAW